MKIYFIRLNDMYVSSFAGDVDDLDVLKHVKLVPLIENAKVFDEESIASTLANTIDGILLTFEEKESD